jgi:hypothetical protein
MGYGFWFGGKDMGADVVTERSRNAGAKKAGKAKKKKVALCRKNEFWLSGRNKYQTYINPAWGFLTLLHQLFFASRGRAVKRKKSKRGDQA